MKFQEFNTRDDEERIYKYNLKYLPTQKKNHAIYLLKNSSIHKKEVLPQFNYI